MKVSRGLVIDAPWIGHILEGRKDWEMRSQPTSHRGWFGLIRKGSGQVVGLANLLDCGKSLSTSEMIETQEHHRIPEAMIRNGDVSKWVIPWKLEDVRRLEQPIPYEHKSGAVTWVLFSDEVAVRLANALEGFPHIPEINAAQATRQIANELVTSTSDRAAVEVQPYPRKPKVPSGSLTEVPGRVLGRTTVTGGNLRNDHFYIREFLDRFPADTIGGSNKSAAAPREITIDWGGPSLVMTDIDRTKGMFRKRGWVGKFFEASAASEGDAIVVTSRAPYRVHVRIERRPKSTASELRNKAS
ncbi:ASCH domain-containing protein [Roseibium suaedae]|uniref:ASCH domain-containing protein n=1 Tax=Roseibium suaedae TaxID=735517 RepID=A0A1M7KM37_9HYPH|nr:ASCH domain-containing protein [Roseibium suaedae]SHM66429.1 ASCH domain-containing protein [Roseibium suaedae]